MDDFIKNAIWKGQAARKEAERAKASFSMQGALDDLRASSERIAHRELRSDFDDAVEVEQVVLAQLQIRAILLAARQLERIADELEGGNDLAFSTALYAVEGEE